MARVEAHWTPIELVCCYASLCTLCMETLSRRECTVGKHGKAEAKLFSTSRDKQTDDKIR